MRVPTITLVPEGQSPLRLQGEILCDETRTGSRAWMVIEPDRVTRPERVAAHLFVVGPEAVIARTTAVLQQRLEGRSGVRERLEVLADPEAMAAFVAMAKVADAASFHPPLYERMAALRRLGAAIDPAAWPGAAPGRGRLVLAVLGGPFRLVAFVFQLAVPAFAFGVALFLGGIYVVPIAALLHAVLR